MVEYFCPIFKCLESIKVKVIVKFNSSCIMESYKLDKNLLLSSICFVTVSVRKARSNLTPDWNFGPALKIDDTSGLCVFFWASQGSGWQKISMKSSRQSSTKLRSTSMTKVGNDDEMRFIVLTTQFLLLG